MAIAKHNRLLLPLKFIRLGSRSRKRCPFYALLFCSRLALSTLKRLTSMVMPACNKCAYLDALFLKPRTRSLPLNVLIRLKNQIQFHAQIRTRNVLLRQAFALSTISSGGQGLLEFVRCQWVLFSYRYYTNIWRFCQMFLQIIVLYSGKELANFHILANFDFFFAKVSRVAPLPYFLYFALRIKSKFSQNMKIHACYL